MLEITFMATIIEWRGPAPFYFAPVPPKHIPAIRAAAKLASYGWGVVPVTIDLGESRFTTSLFPKQGGYLVPLKDAIRRPAGVTVGDSVEITLTIAPKFP